MKKSDTDVWAGCIHFRKSGKANRIKQEYLHLKKTKGVCEYGRSPFLYVKGGKHVKSCGKGKCARFLKKVSSRKIRRSYGIQMKGSGFKKVFDYWWELW